MNETRIIAFLGKGGAGKTMLSSLTGKILIDEGKKVLFIDADPTCGLATALAIDEYQTIGKAREKIIHETRIASKVGESESITETIDYLLTQTLHEEKGFSIIVMGQTDTIGCYCPINDLLRSTIHKISINYDYVIIDAEAGIEQINRQVVDFVGFPIIVTDNALRSVKTAIVVMDTIKSASKIQPEIFNVIFNKVNRIEESHKTLLEQNGLNILGFIPPDAEIASNDINGRSPLTMSSDSKALLKLKNILREFGIIE
jgi:CO dehydrogenase maturation factor